MPLDVIVNKRKSNFSKYEQLDRLQETAFYAFALAGKFFMFFQWIKKKKKKPSAKTLRSFTKNKQNCRYSRLGPRSNNLFADFFK